MKPSGETTYSERSDLLEGELSFNQLDLVAGGALPSWKTVKKAFQYGMQADVVIRNLYDQKNGRLLSYPNWIFEF